MKVTGSTGEVTIRLELEPGEMNWMCRDGHGSIVEEVVVRTTDLTGKDRTHRDIPARAERVWLYGRWLKQDGTPSVTFRTLEDWTSLQHLPTAVQEAAQAGLEAYLTDVARHYELQHAFAPTAGGPTA